MEFIPIWAYKYLAYLQLKFKFHAIILPAEVFVLCLMWTTKNIPPKRFIEECILLESFMKLQTMSIYAWSVTCAPKESQFQCSIKIFTDLVLR